VSEHEVIREVYTAVGKIRLAWNKRVF